MTAKPQHLCSRYAAYQALVQGLKKRQGSKGVHRFEVFCSLTCQAHQCKGTSVMSQGASSWSCWSHWDFHRNFLAELPFISIRLGFSPLCLSSWIYLLSFIAISNFLTMHLQAHKNTAVYCSCVYCPLPFLFAAQAEKMPGKACLSEGAMPCFPLFILQICLFEKLNYKTSLFKGHRLAHKPLSPSSRANTCEHSASRFWRSFWLVSLEIQRMFVALNFLPNLCDITEKFFLPLFIT